LDRVPLLAFTATMGRQWKNRTVQMQVDHRKLYSPLTKWSVELKAGRIYRTLQKAIDIARAEQPGPVHLDFPEDVAAELSDENGQAFRTSPTPATVSDIKSLKKAEDLIKKARYPLVAIGLTMNRAGATAVLREFIRKHRLPVVCTLMAKGHVDQRLSPFVGVLGRARRDIVAEFCKPADLVIAIGYDPVEFNYEDWLPKEVPLLHIDTVPADIAPGYSVPCQVIGDIRSILQRLVKIPPMRHRWDFSALKVCRKRLQTALTPNQAGFAPHHVLESMRELFPAHGLLIADVGAHTHLIGQLWDTRGPGNFLVSNGWSSMGFAIPAAIAAKLVEPGRPVTACVGDGGFLMMVGEINTAVRLGLGVIFVLLRDRYLSLIKVKQGRKGYHQDGVQLFGPNYVSSNNFFGAKVIVAENKEAFREAFKAGLQGGSPLVIEAVVDPSEYDTIV
jgi:acetolactate synthase-1/2/3 large subunit